MNHTLQHISDLPEEKESYLQVLWNKIEKYEVRNQKAEQKVDVLYKEYDSVIIPHEKTKASCQCRLIEHLMTFLSLKQIRPQDRERLFAYLSHEIATLHDFAMFCDMDVLNSLGENLNKHQDKYFHQEKKQALDDACSEIEVTIKGMFGDDVNIPHEDIRSAMNAGDDAALIKIFETIKEEYFESYHEEHIDWDEQDQEWQDFEFNYYQSEEEEASKVTELFKGSQLNKMYKRIANVIHPDKELDPEKREEKHSLMQVLARAKKEKDVVTLIKMYSEFVPDGEHYLDEEAMAHVEHLLEMKVRTLNLAHKDIFNRQGIKSYVWKSFSAPSKKKVREKMENYIEHIERQTHSMEKSIVQLNSLKKVNVFIKSQLRCLEEEYYYDPLRH